MHSSEYKVLVGRYYHQTMCRLTDDGWVPFLSVGFRGVRLQTIEDKQELIFYTCPVTGGR